MLNIIIASFLAFLVGVNLSIVALKLKFHSSNRCVLSFNAANNREKEKEKKGNGQIKEIKHCDWSWVNDWPFRWLSGARWQHFIV